MSRTLDLPSAPAGPSRARLRADVAVAARVLPVHYPLQTFIAVNPLGGLEDLPFEAALRRAGECYGVRGVLPEPAFRAAYADGRITDADLDAALWRHCPDAMAAEPVQVGARWVSAAEVLRADLLHGAPAADPVRSTRMRSEQIAPAVAEIVDELTATWCATFCAGEDVVWPMPGRQDGFYPAWRALAGQDRSLPRGVRDALRRVPARAEDAALTALALLGVGADEQRDYLRAHLTRLPGWSGYLRWRGQHGTGIDLLDFLAVRLTYEALLLQAHGLSPDVPPLPDVLEQSPPLRRAADVARALHAGADATTGLAGLEAVLSALPVEQRGIVWLAAYEQHYRDALLGALDRASAPEPVHRPDAQVVCCIDGRSEGLRRHLETLGSYETLGFAGFFAVAMRYTDLAGGAAQELCPVLVEPGYEISEHPGTSAAAAAAAARRLSGLQALAGAEDAFHAAKDGLLTPFATAEAAGAVAGPLAALKTLLPGVAGSLRRRLGSRAVPPAPTTLGVGEAMALADRVLYAQVALTTMGLTRRFARLVVLCGHGSSTENNPYRAALDCGACGGQRGGPSARAAAAILNGVDVRDGLRELGIDIPADTWFVAAEHDTATDRVDLLDEHLIPDGHRAAADRLSVALRTAGRHLAAERCASLPGAPARTRGNPRAAARHVQTRSADWAQVYPEWGLAGNAAFVVGPRALTRGVDLQRRVFLHSYDADVDEDGAALETILTAPLVVAQWISCQYYFSTVAPEVFGAGSKTVHNAIAGIGVLSGHAGDLQLGLPWQSVADGERLVHEPMRLLAVVQAPLERIQAVIDRNSILQDLIGNEWINLVARAEPDQPWQCHDAGTWRPWLAAATGRPVNPFAQQEQAR